MRALKLLVVLILAGLIGIVGYAYLGDMAPVRQEVRSPLAGPAAAPPTVPAGTGTAGNTEDAGD